MAPEQVIAPRAADASAATKTDGKNDADKTPEFGLRRLSMVLVKPIHEAVTAISLPFAALFVGDLGWAAVGYQLLVGLWTLAVWGLVGAAITRCAAVRLAADERIGWGPMVNFATSKWRSFFVAPLIPLVAVAAILGTMAVAGVLLRFSLGAAVVGVLWPLVLVAAFLVVLLLIGLVLGWPLMYATISVEGRDSFDALGRAYTYVFQRPLHYLFYLFVANFVGFLGGLLIALFLMGTIFFAEWAVGGGAGREWFVALMQGKSEGSLNGFGAYMIKMWVSLMLLFASGYVYSYFWSAMTVIYFLLRRDADGAEMDEVHLDNQEQVRTLPPLGADSRGVPTVTETTTEEAE
jgi:hypothetical protein